jgi:hypothetical protein
MRLPRMRLTVEWVDVAMPRPRYPVRLTLRRMMVAVAIAALAAWMGRVSLHRYQWANWHRARSLRPPGSLVASPLRVALWVQWERSMEARYRRAMWTPFVPIPDYSPGILMPEYSPGCQER